MRSLITTLALLGACTTTTQLMDPPVPPPTPECTTNADCGDDVCGRDAFCSAPSDVRTVHVSWTINHQAADATTCAPSPIFDVEFQTDPISADRGGTIDFARVPCDEGLFTIDRIPTKYWVAGAKTSPTGGSSGMYVPIDETNSAKIDLPY